MIALRLVRLIEDHSDELVEGFLQKLRTSEKTKDMARFQFRNCVTGFTKF